MQIPPETVSTSELQDIVDAVVRVSRALVGVAARSIADLEDEITLAQYRMLVILCSKGPQRPTDLAEALDVTASTAIRMSDRLVTKKFADRSRSESDRRVVRIAATPLGSDLVKTVTERRRREVTKVVEAMNIEDRHAFVEVLSSFADASGELPDQSWTVGWQ
jgi:DNA-binding MarR family transcriptional regulator